MTSLNEGLELVLSTHYADPTVSLVRVDKNAFHEEMNNMIISHSAHVEHKLNKNADDETIEEMPSSDLMHIHQTHEHSTTNEKPQIAEECSRKKTIAKANKDRAHQHLNDAMTMPPPPSMHSKSSKPTKRAHDSDKTRTKLRRTMTTLD